MHRKINEARENMSEDFAAREFLQGKDLSAQTSYGRPQPPNLNDANDDIEFMQIDCDYYTERPKREL